MAEPNRTLTSPPADGGSFRDWNGRVFSADGLVVRALSADGLSDFEALESSRLFAASVPHGELVATFRADEATLAAVRDADPEGRWAGALIHERVPFVSYPYEWTFSMLKDAALLQLRLTSAALDEDLMLKDATPYNVQWWGARPVFIDIGSFERARDGEPWIAYRQFCSMYLFPLLLEAYRGAPFRPWLRGSIDGISPVEFRSLFTPLDVLRRGMLRHVFLHASLERRHSVAGADVRRELKRAGFDRRLVRANVESMARLVDGLRPRSSESAWGDYRSTCIYSEDDAAFKDEFVRRAVARSRRGLVWDLGCNDGRYSLIAAENAEHTVAMDIDQAVVDSLYQRLRAAGVRTVLPLVVDLADPSPALGWRNRERSTLTERGRPDLVLCLAFVHHLSISGNIPLREVVAWLRSLECEVVIEFPHRGDPMVERLLVGKRPDAHPDYLESRFDALVREQFEVIHAGRLTSGTRTLYHLGRR